VRTSIIAANLLLLPLFLALTGCGTTSLNVVPSPTTIVQATPIAVHVHDTHGVSKFTATLAQNGAQYQVWQAPAVSKNADTTFNFEVGVKTTPQLQDGPAHLILEATSGGMFHGTTAGNAMSAWSLRRLSSVRFG
jgi:hypothetical protein